MKLTYYFLKFLSLVLGGIFIFSQSYSQSYSVSYSPAINVYQNCPTTAVSQYDHDANCNSSTIQTYNNFMQVKCTGYDPVTKLASFSMTKVNCSSGMFTSGVVYVSFGGDSYCQAYTAATTVSFSFYANFTGNMNFEFYAKSNVGSTRYYGGVLSINVTVLTPPSTPTGLTHSFGTYNSVNNSYPVYFDWNSTAGATDYELVNCNNIAQVYTSGVSNLTLSLLPSSTYSFKLRSYNANGYSSFTNCYTFTTPSAPLSSNLVCGSSSVTPNPLLNSNPGTFNYSITNTGAGDYTTPLELWFNNSFLNSTSGIISSGQTKTLTYTSSNIISSPGTYTLEIRNSSNIAICSSSVQVIAPTTCVSWTNQPSASFPEVLNSAEYLCNQGIIISTQNGTTNNTTAIKRKDLARIVYLALYGTNNPALPCDSFPTPFGDMQSASAVTSYWYKAAKALSYLEFGDGTSPFGRNFINFRPNDGIERQYAMKVFLEAFNIAPDFSSGSSISDINTAVPEMYGYIKKANSLGIIPNGTFSPTLKITREEAFVMLWKMLTLSSVTKPSLSTLQNSTSYFTPNNIAQSNMNKVLGMEQANFNHYEKTSFVLPGRGLPLEFTHRYSAALTELPEDFFVISNSVLTNQNMNTLGNGWTHNYNQYIIFEPSHIDTLNGIYDTTGAKYYIFWGDGSMEVFNWTKNKYETNGTYHTFQKIGNSIFITDKSKMIYQFNTTTTAGTNVYWIAQIKDRNNNALNFNYQSASAVGAIRIMNVTDATTNRKIDFFYTTIGGKDYLSSISESGLNRTIQFGVNANGDLATFTDPKGQQTIYAYNAGGVSGAHLLTDITLPKGNTIKADYAGRKLQAIKTMNGSTVTSSSTVNWTPTYTTASGSSTSSVTDMGGLSTSYTHNAQGNPSQVISPTTTINNITYDIGENINKPKTMNVQSQAVTMNYDPIGNLLDITKNGITNTFTYTSYNDIATHTDGKGYMTTYGYTNNNLTSITRPSGGGVVNITRNTNGQPETITNPTGIVTTLGYNTFGNLNSIQLPLGISTGSTYDNASRLKTKTDAVNNTTTYDYDNNDNVWKITDALNGITELGYDLNDNNTTIKNAKNETTTKTYKFAEDLLETETFGPHTKSYAYYPDGKLQTHVKGNGTYNYVYDTQGRLSTDGHSSYTYDNRSNVATITNSNGTLNLFYDVNDRLDYYTDYYGNTVQYTYDNNHNVSTIKYPGNKVVTYTYDANNRCTQVSDWLSQVTKFYYLIDDRIDSVKYSNGTSTKYLYDAAGRNTGMNNRKANGAIINEYTFNLNNAGNHLSETMNEPALSNGLNTLTSATTNYNAMPYNRIQNAGATTFTHNNQGQITNRAADTYTFDVNDNLLTVNGSATGTFSYDGAGNRRSKTLNGITTKYVLSILGMSQVLMETDASNDPSNYYVYGPTGLISRIKPNNTTHVYHYDYRGSTIAISDASSNLTHTYSYDPFGNVLAANEPANDLNPFRYVGQQGVQYETPTLTFMRARYADLTTGRFISEDPIWATNLYPYADNNPVMGVDPSGELFSKKVRKYIWKRIGDYSEDFFQQGVDAYYGGQMLEFYMEGIITTSIKATKAQSEKDYQTALSSQSIYLANMINYFSTNLVKPFIGETAETWIDLINDTYVIYKGDKYDGNVLISDKFKELLIDFLDDNSGKVIDYSDKGWKAIFGIK
jgi:RHS repeat-associated protein